MEESDQLLVSSRGILKSCDIHDPNPSSSVRHVYKYDWASIDRPVSIYICSSALRDFFSNAVSKIKVPFVLVTGDSDQTIFDDLFTPDEMERIFSNENLLHVYGQNMVSVHDRITKIPIGLDYHTMRHSDCWGSKQTPAEQEADLFSLLSVNVEKANRAYANYQFLMTTRYGSDRKDAKKSISPDLVYYEPNHANRVQCWQNMIKYKYVISPHGNGYDCHRTWEALALGSIPIVKTSALDSLFDDLPVLIVEKWSDVTSDLLTNYPDRSNEVPEKLYLKYWTDQIKRSVAI